MDLGVPVRWLQGDIGREAGGGEIHAACPLQAVREGVHVFGDNLLYEGGVFAGDRKQCENIQAALLTGPCVGALQCQVGELPCLYSFVGTAQIVSGRVDVRWHVGEVQVQQLAGVPAAVGHVDRQVDGEEGGHRIGFLLIKAWTGAAWVAGSTLHKLCRPTRSAQLLSYNHSGCITRGDTRTSID